MSSPKRIVPPLQEAAFIREVSSLSPAEQIPRVMAKLKELNPHWYPNDVHYEFDALKSKIAQFALGQPDSTEEGDPIIHRVKEVWPVRALTKLEHLNLGFSLMNSVDPIASLSLTSLQVNFTPVADLFPLKNMPLNALNIRNTAVADLTPLKNMPLTSLDISHTKVANLTPLKNRPLTSLDMSHTEIADLAPLKNLPLTSLDLGFTKVTDLLPLEGMKLTKLNCFGLNIRDLTPLKNMPLTSLAIVGSDDADLTLLKDMPLQRFYGKIKPENIELFRSISTLQIINLRPAAEVLEMAKTQGVVK